MSLGEHYSLSTNRLIDDLVDFLSPTQCVVHTVEFVERAFLKTTSSAEEGVFKILLLILKILIGHINNVRALTNIHRIKLCVFLHLSSFHRRGIPTLGDSFSRSLSLFPLNYNYNVNPFSYVY